MADHLDVMTSSTARDLPAHREAVRDACLQLGIFPHMMEHLPASDAEAIRASLEMVEKADIYIGIIAHRYGYVPKGHDTSITEMEYNHAVQLGKPRLIFLMHDDHMIKPSDIERGPSSPKLEALKKRLETERVVKYFKSPEDLRAHVLHALSEARSQLTGTRLPSREASRGPSASSWEKSSLQKLVESWEYIEIEKLPAGAANKLLRMLLDEVRSFFESQRVRLSAEEPLPSPHGPSRKIFICYRREDSGVIAGRIYDHLSSHFGRDSVFMDIVSIPPGTDFRMFLEQAVSQCDVLLVMIGDKWLVSGPSGQRRLDNPDDFVRIEIETALQANIPVIPVLVDKAIMPSSSDLPRLVSHLSMRNAARVDPGADFRAHIDRLIQGIERLLS